MDIGQNHFKIIPLIVQFWISGLLILGIIFTSVEQLSDLNLYMFIALAAGSIVGGILCDWIGRITTFKIFSALLSLSTIVCLVDSFFGHIMAATFIGSLNNLTFVLIAQQFPDKKQKYTTSVLVGWAFSQVTLGIYFSITNNIRFFYLIIVIFTIAYSIAVFLFFQENQNVHHEQLMNLDQEQEEEWWTKFVPTSKKHLVGGCLLMFVMQMFYYRTQFTLDQFGVSLSLNTLVVGFAEGIADIAFGFLSTKIKRKTALRIFIVFLMVLFLLLVLIKNKVMQTVIEGIMRLGDAGVMLILGIYLPELFKEKERGKGVNFIMSIGVIGSALNQKILKNFPFWFLAVFLVIALLSTILFKETKEQCQNNND